MRKSILRKITVAGLIVIMSLFVFSGCEFKSDTPIVGKIVGLKSDEIFKTGKIVCSKAEYMLAMLDAVKKYQTDFGGKIDWQAKVDDDITFEEFVKEKVKEDITVRYTLAAMAKNNNVSLSAAEKDDIKKSASDYYAVMTDEEKDYTGAQLNDVENLYMYYKLADKVYSGITKNAGNDISEEDARVIKIQYIRMDASIEKTAKIKSLLKDIKSVVEGGYQEFSREAKQYSCDDTFEREIKKSEALAKYEIEAFNLNKGKISDIIEDGTNYYLVYCVDNYMKEETAENKQNIIDNAKERSFNEQYGKFVKEADCDFNSSQWKKIEVFKQVK